MKFCIGTLFGILILLLWAIISKQLDATATYNEVIGMSIFIIGSGIIWQFGSNK